MIESARQSSWLSVTIRRSRSGSRSSIASSPAASVSSVRQSCLESPFPYLKESVQIHFFTSLLARVRRNCSWTARHTISSQTFRLDRVRSHGFGDCVGPATPFLELTHKQFSNLVSQKHTINGSRTASINACLRRYLHNLPALPFRKMIRSFKGITSSPRRSGITSSCAESSLK
jgi:hypothetical protein